MYMFGISGESLTLRLRRSTFQALLRQVTDVTLVVSVTANSFPLSVLDPLQIEYTQIICAFGYVTFSDCIYLRHDEYL